MARFTYFEVKPLVEEGMTTRWLLAVRDQADLPDEVGQVYILTASDVAELRSKLTEAGA